MSAIGKRLGQLPAIEIRDSIYAPLLQAGDAAAHADMLAMNAAHLVMLHECGLLAPDVTRVLARALRELRDAGPGTPPTDTTIEDAYFAFELRLGEQAGAAVAGHLHLARSRNDIGATLDRMRVRRLNVAIRAALLDVRRACLARAAAHLEAVMPGYTHLQPAQPITYGFLLASYEEALARDHERLAQAHARADQCALGVAALAGSGFAIDRARTAQLLGFAGITAQGLDTVGSRDAVTELAYAATQLGVTWNRIAQDMHTFVSDEFSALAFPDSVAGISSIMPQKKNPVALEWLRAQSARHLGALTGALAAVRGTHFTVALDAIREGLADAFAMLDATPASLRMLRLVIDTAEPQQALLLQRCRDNFSTATDLADALVSEHGLSFRDAHHVVGCLVRLALDAGLHAGEVDAALLAQAAQDVLGRPISMNDADLRDMLDPARAVARRQTPGGTAPATVSAALDVARGRLDADATLLAQATHAHEAAAAELAACLDALAA